MNSQIVDEMELYAASAKAAVRKAGDLDDKTADGRLFQSLQYIVRDWDNFDDDTWEQRDGDEARKERLRKYNVTPVSRGDKNWDEKHCEEQMRLHKDMHLGGQTTAQRSVENLKSYFKDDLSVFLLPRPGD